MILTIAKVGGSLFDLPELRVRLHEWRASVMGSVIFIPGGGEMADIIRRAQPIHQLSESSAHEIAIRTMTLNAHLLSALTGWPIVEERTGEHTAILDVYPICTCALHLPQSWSVTSDTIAARIANTWKADLVLLKSTDLPPVDWEQAAKLGLVDEAFPKAVQKQRVRWINLRREM